ncbi:hypothetical protein FHETE_10285 [Fusarium heterosporum]|uniref:Uncharacterized protein n=1 Tax=Fusarium heterosporum TaxID=42747 RepID=A0A8H5WGJ5_FUSHE|nr:hypothetical protein FHETE_10285 [Fusarium heterosporum]
MAEKLKPATNLDSNVWYQLSELAVDNNKDPLHAMLQPTSVGGDLRVGDANKQSYWQFQKIDDKPGRYQMRCSDTTVKKQLSLCYRPASEVIDEKKRTRPCLMPIDDSDAQKWENGTDWNLDCIPNGPVFMSSNLEGDQPRQHWLMSSVAKVNDEMYSTVYTAPPETTGGTTATSGSDTSAPTTTGTSGSSSSEPTSSDTSGDSTSAGLSSGAIAGISVAATLGVVALALAAFFLWRRNKRKQTATGISAEPSNKYSNSPATGSPHTPYNETYATNKVHTPSEMAQPPAELPNGAHQRHEMP